MNCEPKSSSPQFHYIEAAAKRLWARIFRIGALSRAIKLAFAGRLRILGQTTPKEKRIARTEMKDLLTTSMVLWIICRSLSAGAQGVHLSAGDTLSVGFDQVSCVFFEGGNGTAFGSVFFNGDLLDPGESLRLEMFENGLGEAAIAAQTFSPTATASSVSLNSFGA